jgi:hypothetical protein
MRLSAVFHHFLVYCLTTSSKDSKSFSAYKFDKRKILPHTLTINVIFSKREFMKKTVTIVLALMSASAFASKARLQALGENVNGSFYIQDNRNMFLNANEVNNYKDFLTFETGASTGTNTETTPRAEGGFFRTMGAMNYGLYLGSQYDRTNDARGQLTAAQARTNNPLDLFVGGDAGSVKWGANLTYSSSNDASTRVKSDYTALRLGAQVMSNLNVFVQTDINNKVTVGNTVSENTAKGKMAGSVGATYMINDLKVFAQYGSDDSKFTSTNGGQTQEFKNNSYLVGVGREASVNDKTKVYTKLQYSQVGNTIELDGITNRNTHANQKSIPVTIGLEHDALSWLTLRGSVVQNLWDSNNQVTAGVGEKNIKNAQSTQVNTGATLTLGSLKLDGVIGTTNPGTRAVGSNNGTLSLDNLMSRVALRYNF